MPLRSPTEGGEKEGGGEVFKQEGQQEKVKEDETDTSTCPEANEAHEDQPEVGVAPGEEQQEERREEQEKTEKGSTAGEEGDAKDEDNQEENTEKWEDSREGESDWDSKGEEKMEVIPS